MSNDICAFIEALIKELRKAGSPAADAAELKLYWLKRGIV